MRKLMLAAVSILSLAAAEPAFPQGLQMPGAPNATPPAGTLPDGRTSTAQRRRRYVRRHRPAHRRPVQSEQQQQPSIQAPRIA